MKSLNSLTRLRLRTSFFIILVLCGTLNVWAQRSDPELDRARASLVVKRIPSGVLVVSVTSGGTADHVGIHVGDLIWKVNSQVILGNTEFAAVRDSLVGKKDIVYTIVRYGNELSLTGIMTSPFGITGQEWSYTLEMTKRFLLRGQPDDAEAVFRQGSEAGQMNSEQAHLGKLLLLPDGPANDNSERARLVNELRAMLSPDHLPNAFSTLSAAGKRESAVFIADRALQEKPGNADWTLDRAALLAEMGRGDEAESAVNFFLDRSVSGLNSYGVSVAKNVLSIVAQNRGRWQEAFNDHAQRLVLYSYHSNGVAMRHVYLAAHLKDESQFQDAQKKAKEVAEWDYAVYSPLLDGVVAFFLADTGKEAEAQRIAQNLSGSQRAWVSRYWRMNGPDVAAVWDKLR